MIFMLRILFEASVRISVVAIAVWGIVHLVRIQSSSLRHKAWSGVLLAMLLMPVLPRLVPRLDLPALAPVPSTAQAGAAPRTPGAVAAAPAALPLQPTGMQVAADPAVPRRPDRQILPTLLETLYGAGALILLVRLLAGWWFAHRLVASSRGIALPGMNVYECAKITTPITVGITKPRILLPPGWTDWPQDKITAVLAHEAEHVRRRDTLVGFLAHFNRAVFWFHPLAWWLQRRLALDAEQACDDAGVKALGGIRKYTEVLLDIAEAVSRRGGAFAIYGAGVDGAGLLGPRIDRLLHGLPAAAATKAQKAVLAALTVPVVFLSAACQQKPLPALKADPDYARQIAQSVARNNMYQEINRMTAEDAAALEAKVRQNLEDGDARDKLMAFYQAKGREVLGDERATKGFWTVKLWCIEHHPEDFCASSTEPLFDQESYQKGAKLWESILRRPDVTPDLQVAAAGYFRRADPKRAEEIAIAAKVDEQRRAGLLSGIYAVALSTPSAGKAYVEDLRKRLDQSTDAALLSMTGFSLARGQLPDSEASILGHKYIQRAKELAPASVNQDELARMDQNQASGQVYRELRAVAGSEISEAQYQKIAALSPEQRAQILPTLAEQAYWAGANRLDYNHDSASARKDWDLSRKYAKDALTIEESFRNDPDYTNRVYKANIILAMLALRAGENAREARKYLLTAAPLKTTDNWFPATLKFLVLLLRYGNADDRAAVIKFCEIHGKAAPPRSVDLIQSAQKLRQGVMPTWYQYEVTQFK